MFQHQKHRATELCPSTLVDCGRLWLAVDEKRHSAIGGLEDLDSSYPRCISSGVYRLRIKPTSRPVIHNTVYSDAATEMRRASGPQRHVLRARRSYMRWDAARRLGIQCAPSVHYTSLQFEACQQVTTVNLYMHKRIRNRIATFRASACLLLSPAIPAGSSHSCRHHCC